MLSLILSGIFLISAPPQGQQEPSFKRLGKEEVPEAVRTSYKKIYDAEVVNWELHNSNKFPPRYVAIFDHDGLRHRARFNSAGEGLSVSTYYLFNRLRMLPQDVIQRCERDFPDYRIGSGEKISSLKNNRTVFRIRLRKAAELKIIYLDQDGKILDPAFLASEFQAIEDNQ